MKITSQLNAPGELTSHILPNMTAIHIGTDEWECRTGAETALIPRCVLVKGGLQAEYHVENIENFIWGKKSRQQHCH